MLADDPILAPVAEESVSGFLQLVHSAANGSTIVSTFTEVVNNNFLHWKTFKVFKNLN